MNLCNSESAHIFHIYGLLSVDLSSSLIVLSAGVKFVLNTSYFFNLYFYVIIYQVLEGKWPLTIYSFQKKIVD